MRKIKKGIYSESDSETGNSFEDARDCYKTLESVVGYNLAEGKRHC